MTVSYRGHARVSDSSGKLASWKSIADYFDCDERTAKRWERERGLPVHRAPGGKRSAVFAYPSELDIWLRTGDRKQDLHSGTLAEEPEAEEDPATPLAAESQMATERESASISAQAPSSKSAVFRRWPVWTAAGTAAFLIITGALLVRRARTTILESFRVRASSGVSPHVPAPGAEELYLQGRYFWNLRTADGLSKAIDAYTQAIVKDPSYAEAYAGLAESYDLLPQFADANLSEAFAKAKNAADKGIQLNPNLAAAHRAKAFALFFWDWDIPGSDAEFQRALVLDPNSAETHHWYASTLLNRLEGDEAMKQIDEALRLNPTSAAIATDAALIHADFGDNLDASMKKLREIGLSQPALLTPSSFLGAIDFATGDYPGYLAELRRIASITHNPDDIAAADGAERGWAQAGKTGLLEALIRSQKKAFEHGTEPGFWLGQIYLVLGRPKEALPYFNAALDEHFIMLITMQDCDWAKALSNDPDYAALFARIRERMHGGNTAHPLVVPVSFRLPH